MKKQVLQIIKSYATKHSNGDEGTFNAIVADEKKRYYATPWKGRAKLVDSLIAMTILTKGGVKNDLSRM